MAFHVQREMVRPGEGSVAFLTLKWSVARMLPVMPRELIRTGEFPATSLPVTVIRLLSCVGSVMGFEVGTLGVRFTTACIVAHVRSYPLPRPRATTTLGLGFFRQTLGWRNKLLVLQGLRRSLRKT